MAEASLTLQDRLNIHRLCAASRPQHVGKLRSQFWLQLRSRRASGSGITQHWLQTRTTTSIQAGYQPAATCGLQTPFVSASWVRERLLFGKPKSQDQGKPRTVAALLLTCPGTEVASVRRALPVSVFVRQLWTPGRVFTHTSCAHFCALRECICWCAVFARWRCVRLGPLLPRAMSGIIVPAAKSPTVACLHSPEHVWLAEFGVSGVSGNALLRLRLTSRCFRTCCILQLTIATACSSPSTMRRSDRRPRLGERCRSRE